MSCWPTAAAGSREMLSHGVTTIEAKSGYGLDVETELRLLAVMAELDREGPIEIVPTFLGAHAVPPEFRGRPDATEAYLDSVIGEQLPAVAEQGIAPLLRRVLRARRVRRRAVTPRAGGRGTARTPAAAPRR